MSSTPLGPVEKLTALILLDISGSGLSVSHTWEILLWKEEGEKLLSVWI